MGKHAISSNNCTLKRVIGNLGETIFCRIRQANFLWLISLVLEIFVASVLCRATIEKCFQIAASVKLAVGLVRLLGKNFSLYSICFDFIYHIS